LGAHIFVVFPLKYAALNHRKPGITHSHVHHSKRFLTCLTASFSNHEARKDLDLFVPTPDQCIIIPLGCLKDLLPNVRNDIGAGQYGTITTSQHRHPGDLIMTAEDADGISKLFQSCHKKRHVATGIFQANDIVKGQSHTFGSPPAEVGPGGLWDVIEHKREANRVQFPVVIIHFVESRFYEIWGTHQGSTGASVFGPLCQFQGLQCAGTAGTGKDGNLAPDFLYADPDDLLPFLKS
jgi:hypothetical protein